MPIKFRDDWLKIKYTYKTIVLGLLRLHCSFPAPFISHHGLQLIKIWVGGTSHILGVGTFWRRTHCRLTQPKLPNLTGAKGFGANMAIPPYFAIFLQSWDFLYCVPSRRSPHLFSKGDFPYISPSFKVVCPPTFSVKGTSHIVPLPSVLGTPHFDHHPSKLGGLHMF